MNVLKEKHKTCKEMLFWVTDAVSLISSVMPFDGNLVADSFK